MHIVEIRGADIRILGYSFQDHHLTGLALKSCLYCSTAYLISLGDIHTGGQMSCTALEGGQFDSSGLAAQFLDDQVGQIFTGTG